MTKSSKNKASKRPSVPIWATLKALYGKFRPAILAQGGLITVAFVLVLVAVGFRIAEPWPLKFVFDGLMSPDATTGIGALDRLEWQTELAVLIGAFVFVVVAHTGLTFLSKMAMALAFRRMLSRIRSEIFDHLLRMSVLNHHKYGKGDLSNRVTVDIDRLRLAGTNNAINLVVNVLTMACMLAVMFWVNWQLALIALVAVPLFQLLTRLLIPQITANSLAFRASDGSLASETVYATSAVDTIQGMMLFDRAQTVLDRGSEENLILGMRNTVLKTILRQSVMVLFALVIGLLVWRGALLVGSGTITLGDLIIFMSYLREGMEKPMVRFSSNLADIGRAAASGERLLSLFREARGPEGGTRVLQQPVRGKVQFKDIHFSYPDGPPVLKGVNFTLNPGERVAIVGASGSGKSTLISLLLRLYDPQSGQISFDGVNIQELDRKALTSAVVPVFQDSALFADTIRENLTLGREKVPDGAIDFILQATASKTFVEQLDGGLNHKLKSNGGTLSGGQTQRLGIARALLRLPNVLLLDEPTSALDPDSRDAVLRCIMGPSRSTSILMITHDNSDLENFDKVYRLEEGRLRLITPPARLVDETAIKAVS